jgi:phage terminase small subunit
MPVELNPKQERFCQEYLIDLNATQAAIRAGYSEKTARQTAAENLSKPDIQKRIQELQNACAKRVEVTVDEVVREYKRLAFLDIRKAFTRDGVLLPVTELDDDTAAAIAGLEIEELFNGTGKGRKVIGRTHKLKLCDKRGALDSLGRHLGMFIDRQEITGKEGEKLFDFSGFDSSELESIVSRARRSRSEAGT